MRTTKDRIRHTLLFQFIAMSIVVPGSAAIMGTNLTQTGLLTVTLAVVATLWNYFYNWAVDQGMQRYLKRLNKTWGERVAHAVGYETLLLLGTTPLVIWFLDLSLNAAFAYNTSMMVFFAAYAFLFNLTYDKVFPIPQTTHQS